MATRHTGVSAEKCWDTGLRSERVVGILGWAVKGRGSGEGGSSFQGGCCMLYWRIRGSLIVTCLIGSACSVQHPKCMLVTSMGSSTIHVWLSPHKSLPPAWVWGTSEGLLGSRLGGWRGSKMRKEARREGLRKDTTCWQAGAIMSLSRVRRCICCSAAVCWFAVGRIFLLCRFPLQLMRRLSGCLYPHGCGAVPRSDLVVSLACTRQQSNSNSHPPRVSLCTAGRALAVCHPTLPSPLLLEWWPSLHLLPPANFLTQCLHHQQQQQLPRTLRMPRHQLHQQMLQAAQSARFASRIRRTWRSTAGTW